MDEASAGLVRSIGRVIVETVEEALEHHIDRMHIPPPRRGPVTAIPFANIQVDDSKTCHAWEMMSNNGASLEEAAYAVGVPSLALERALYEYRPAWRHFLQERASGA